MNAPQLYKKFSLAELVEMQRAICADPANRNLTGGIHRYTTKTRNKLDVINLAITFHLADKNKGGLMAQAGYTGAKRNRR